MIAANDAIPGASPIPQPDTTAAMDTTATPADTTTGGLPAAVSVECPAKTNLTLKVGAACAAWGGRHELETLYCAVGVTDTVTATRKPAGSGFSLELAGTHLGDLASSGSDMRRNHAVLALFAMARAAGRAPDVGLAIVKRIPVGAGLGGGSADAAATILALNALWRLDWPIDRLREVAAGLGADMPFCLTGGYAHGTGYGERIAPIAPGSAEEADLKARGYAGGLLVGAYQAQLSTPEVYATFDALGPGPGDANHLQRAAVELHPRSGEAIDLALAAGATHAFVSGSGPSVVAFAPTDGMRQAVIEAWTRAQAVDRIIAAEAPAAPRVSVTL